MMKLFKSGLQQELEIKAASALLGEGELVEIEGLGKFEIKPLKLGAMAMIAKEAAIIEQSETDVNTWKVIGSSMEYAKPAAKIAAIAILGERKKIEKYCDELTERLYWYLTPESLSTIIGAIVTQSKVDFFFSCTIQLSRMRMMKPKAATPETTASGEQ